MKIWKKSIKKSKLKREELLNYLNHQIDALDPSLLYNINIREWKMPGTKEPKYFKEFRDENNKRWESQFHFNQKVLKFMEEQIVFNQKISKFMIKQDTFNQKIISLPTIKKELEIVKHENKS